MSATSDASSSSDKADLTFSLHNRGIGASLNLLIASGTIGSPVPHTVLLAYVAAAGVQSHIN